MQPNEIAEAARKKIEGNITLEAEMRSEWAKVEDAITAHALASKKKWKVYEVNHISRVARLEMLTSFVAGKTPQECAAAALLKVGLSV